MNKYVGCFEVYSARALNKHISECHLSRNTVYHYHLLQQHAITWLDIVGSVYHLVIYMQSNKIHNVFQWVSLFGTYVSWTCFGPHRSIIRSVSYKLYSQTLVCGTTVRTTRHVQPLQSCRKCWINLPIKTTLHILLDYIYIRNNSLKPEIYLNNIKTYFLFYRKTPPLG